MSTHGDTRGEANPIDWTKPLRVVGTHESALVFSIYPHLDDPIEIRINGRSGRVGRDGKGFLIDDRNRTGDIAVENIPPEPRIVERWGYAELIDKIGHAHGYTIPEQWAQNNEHAPIPRGTRKVKFLIEETE